MAYHNFKYCYLLNFVSLCHKTLKYSTFDQKLVNPCFVLFFILFLKRFREKAQFHFKSNRYNSYQSNSNRAQKTKNYKTNGINRTDTNNQQKQLLPRTQESTKSSKGKSKLRREMGHHIGTSSHPMAAYPMEEHPSTEKENT